MLSTSCNGKASAEPSCGGGCQAIDNPDASLQGYMQFTPDQKRNNPEAGNPAYIFLAAGPEAVVIEGPTVMGSLQIQNPSISIVNPRATGAN